MSAVPKKKLCWNCEGNVAKDIDNCPYCGVYLHALDVEEESDWNPSYHPSSKTEEIPSPLYQQASSDDNEHTAEENSSTEGYPWMMLINQLRHDLFPLLFLMMGSMFFLFAIILLLFSPNGTFTLQWQSQDGYYFLIGAVPLLVLGWKYLQELAIETEE